MEVLQLIEQASARKRELRERIEGRLGAALSAINHLTEAKLSATADLQSFERRLAEAQVQLEQQNKEFEVYRQEHHKAHAQLLEQAEAEKRAALASKQELEAVVANLQAEKTALERVAEEHQAMLSKTVADAEAHKCSTAQVNDLKNTVEALTATNREYALRVEQMEHQRNTIERSLHDKSSLVEQLTGEKCGLQAELEAAKNALTQHTAQFEKQTNEALQEKALLSEQVRSQLEQQQAHKNELASLQLQHTSVLEELKLVQKAYEDQKTIEAETVAKYDNDLRGLRRTNELQQQELEATISRLTKAQEELATFGAEKLATSKLLEDLQQQCIALTEANKQLEERCVAGNSETSRLAAIVSEFELCKTRKDDLEEQSMALRREIATMTQEFKNLQNKSDGLAQANAELQQQMNALQGEHSAALANLAEQKHGLSRQAETQQAAEAQVANLSIELQHSRSEVESLKVEITSLQQTSSHLESETKRLAALNDSLEQRARETLENSHREVSTLAQRLAQGSEEFSHDRERFVQNITDLENQKKILQETVDESCKIRSSLASELAQSKEYCERVQSEREGLQSQLLLTNQQLTDVRLELEKQKEECAVKCVALEEAQKLQQSLSLNVQQLQQTLDSQRTRIEELISQSTPTTQHRQAELETECARISALLTEKDKIAETALQRSVKAEAETTEAIERLRLLETEVGAAMALKENLQKTALAAEAEIARLGEAVASTQTQLDFTNKQLAGVTEELLLERNEKQRALEESVKLREPLTLENQQLRQTVEQQHAQIQAMSSQSSTNDLQAQIAALQSEYSRVMGVLTEKEKHAAAADAMHQSLTLELQQSQQTIAEQHARVQELSSQSALLTDTQAQLAASQEERSRLAAVLLEKEKTLAAAEQQSLSAQTELTRTSERLQKLEAESENSRQKLLAAEAEILRLEGAHAVTQKELELQIASLSASVSSFAGEKTRLEMVVKSLQEQLASVSAELVKGQELISKFDLERQEMLSARSQVLDETTKLQTELSKQRDEANEHVSRLLQQIAALEQTHQEGLVALQEAKGFQTTSTREIQDLQQLVAAQRETINALTTESTSVRELQEQISALKVEQLKQQELFAEKVQLNNQTTEKLRVAEAEIHALKANDEELGARLRAAEAESSRLVVIKNELEKRASEGEAGLLELRQRLDEVTTARETEQIRSEKAIKDLEQEKNAALSALREETAIASNKVAELQEMLSSKEKLYQDQLATYEAARTLHNERTSQIEELKQQLETYKQSTNPQDQTEVARLQATLAQQAKVVQELQERDQETKQRLREDKKSRDLLEAELRRVETLARDSQEEVQTTTLQLNEMQRLLQIKEAELSALQNAKPATAEELVPENPKLTERFNTTSSEVQLPKQDEATSQPLDPTPEVIIPIIPDVAETSQQPEDSQNRESGTLAESKRLKSSHIPVPVTCVVPLPKAEALIFFDPNGEELKTDTKAPEDFKPARESTVGAAPGSPTSRASARFSLFGPADHKQLREEFRNLRELLKNINADWEKRVNAMSRIEEMVRTGGLQNVKGFNEEADSLRACLAAQLADLRSNVVKEACKLLVCIAEVQGPAFEDSLSFYLPLLFKNIFITIKVINESAHLCAKSLMEVCHTHKALPPLLTAAVDPHPAVRRRSMEYMEIFFRQPDTKPTAEQVIVRVMDTLKKGLQDSDKNVRTSARGLFEAFSKRFPPRAKRLFEELPLQTQKLIESEATKSRESEKSGLIKRKSH